MERESTNNLEHGNPSPSHKREFELYYSLGETRKLVMVARILFQEHHPDTSEKHPEFHKKFGSFYVKIKRWAAKERWNEAIRERTLREIRRSHENEAFSEDLATRIRQYQGVFRDLLSVFAYKVHLSLMLRNAVELGQDEEIFNLRRKIDALGEVKINDIREAESALRFMQQLKQELPEALSWEMSSKLGPFRK